MTATQVQLLTSAYCHADRAAQLAEKLFSRVADNPGADQIELPIEQLAELRRLLSLASDSTNNLIGNILANQQPERG